MPLTSFLAGTETVQIAHPLLRKWVNGAPVATKLTATLSSEEMLDDVWISWKPFSEKGATRFSERGAFVYATNWGMALITVSLLSACVFGPASRIPAKRLARIVCLVTGSGILLALILYGLLPKTEVRLVRGHGPPGYETAGIGNLVNIICAQETNADEARFRMTMGMPIPNYLSGGSVREEDSPGNYQLRQAGNRVEYTIYDAIGAPSSQ